MFEVIFPTLIVKSLKTAVKAQRKTARRLDLALGYSYTPATTFYPEPSGVGFQYLNKDA